MRFFAALLHFLHALRICMLNAMSISAYGNTRYYLYKLQINANAFTDLHCGYAIRISVYGNGPLLCNVGDNKGTRDMVSHILFSFKQLTGAPTCFHVGSNDRRCQITVSLE